MADALSRMVGPVLLTATAGTETTLYTVPAATQAILRYVRFLNVTSTAATVTMSIGADSTTSRLVYFSVAPLSIVEWTTNLPLAAAETLRAIAGTANAINVLGTGVLVT